MTGWEEIARVVGERHVLRCADEMVPYLADDRGLFEGVAAGVVCPGTTGEVADVVGICVLNGCLGVAWVEDLSVPALER